MRQLANYSAGFCALLAAAACDSGVITSRETAANADMTGPTLAEVRAAVAAPPVLAKGKMIDPAAKNIDPFTQAYTSEQTETYSALAIKAAAQENYLDGSVTEAKALLTREMPQIEHAGYEEGLTCAARFDVAARDGALSAHRGQQYARDVLNATVLGYENMLRAQNQEDEANQLIDDYRSKSYINYTLIRNQLMQDEEGQNTDGKDMLAQGETCYEKLGLVMPDTTSENDPSDDTQKEPVGDS